MINILGVYYCIRYRTEEDDKTLKDCDGYVDYSLKDITILKINEEDKSDKEYKKKVLRHEIIHAFLHESGLSFSSSDTEHWAINEEMIDWFAIQSPKIYKAYKDAEVI